ncbi:MULTISPECIES: TetR/AcrR family transcriptional regulator [unclassified Virgibacillus]|uniref:TetR/AcrR family transcriptional regulator n=1 Tax=unclassified Virgibacillus TaxID=2620237 RepID=UPI0024DE2D68|nr:TetR/AcrR family transcriptional regulator [Virgibacillus sp. LDC-1]
MNGFERRKHRKKQAILEAALALFKESGFQSVPVSTVAKKANVSQVTIYNYFGNKDELIDEVMKYYINNMWLEYDALFKSDLTFPEKVKQIIFEKKETANQMSARFFEDFMKHYAGNESYWEKLYKEKVLPQMMQLFDDGKAQGYVNRQISNEAILVYMQLFKEALQREELSASLLPITEDLTTLFFYGISGGK